MVVVVPTRLAMNRSDHGINRNDQHCVNYSEPVIESITVSNPMNSTSAVQCMVALVFVCYIRRSTVRTAANLRYAEWHGLYCIVIECEQYGMALMRYSDCKRIFIYQRTLILVNHPRMNRSDIAVNPPCISHGSEER